MMPLTIDRPGTPGATQSTPALERLFSTSWTLTVNVVNAAIVVAILWGTLPAAMLLGWLAIMTALVVARLVLAQSHARAPASRPAAAWARLHAIGSGATGLNWGLTGVVPVLVDDPFAHVLVVMTAAGMGAGALVLSFVHLPSFRAFVLAHSVPVVAGIALHGGPTYQAIAAMGLVFIVVLDRIGASFNHNFIETQALQRRLVASEQRMRDFAEAASHWVWETGPDGRFTLMSDGIERFTGADARSFIGCLPGERMGQAPPSLEIAAAMARGNAFMDCLAPLRHPDGRNFTLAVSGKPIFDEAGRFAGYRGISRDVTAQRAAELAAEEMRRARDVAAAADQLKTRFLASISHELRTPLNAVIGFSEVMEREMLGPLGTVAYKTYAHDIRASGQHLLELINDLLDMSRIELGHYRVTDSTWPIREVVEMSVGIVHAAIGGDIEIACDGVEAGLVVRADPRALRQVLINLLSNAARAAPRGSSVTVTATRESGAGAIVTVRDAGPGIPPHELEMVFKPFNSSDPERTRRGGGTGLGLWISRTLVELHGGTLTLASDGAHGTTATIRLPAERVVSAAA